MRLINADYLKEAISNNSLIDFTDDDLFEIIDNAPTIKPCENCDLYFMAKTKEEMKKGGAE